MGYLNYSNSWLYDFNSLLINGGYVGMVVEPDAGVDIFQDLLQFYGGMEALTNHKDRRSSAGYTAAKGAGRPSFSFHLVQTGDPRAAHRFDDDVFCRPAA